VQARGKTKCGTYMKSCGIVFGEHEAASASISRAVIFDPDLQNVSRLDAGHYLYKAVTIRLP
tara:strand:+ start:825 stop:1010 length:186 start_codon:yes stop_codon:yes gene_type:complete